MPIIGGIMVFTLLIFIYHKWSFQYWERKGVHSIEGKFLFGNIKDLLFCRKTLIEFLGEMYQPYKSEGLIGFYSFYRPMLMATSLDTIKAVLVTNFNCFADNGYRIYVKADPMFGINPFCITGLQNWKNIRGIHAPFHSLGKLKELYPTIKRVGHNLICYIEKNKLDPIDIIEVMGFYTIGNIMSCGYGLKANVFSDKENAFRKCTSSQLFTGSALANLSALYFPSLAKLLSLRIVSKEAENFFVSMVKSVIEFRSQDGSLSNDFISHLIKYNQKKLDENKKGFTDLEFAGHSITLYLDGYETSASALSFILLELANHPQVQEKLRKEIKSAGNNIDDFNYEKINSLEYLAMTLNETLRIHPLLPVLSRECTEKVNLGNIVIEKGTKIFIPTKCIHYDEDYFPDPHSFNPERFSDENNFPKYAFLSFGEGPRICLGFRFALLQIKVAVVFILLNFRIIPSYGKLKEVIEDDPKAPFVVTPKKGTKLAFQSLSPVRCPDY